MEHRCLHGIVIIAVISIIDSRLFSVSCFYNQLYKMTLCKLPKGHFITVEVVNKTGYDFHYLGLLENVFSHSLPPPLTSLRESLDRLFQRR